MSHHLLLLFRFYVLTTQGGGTSVGTLEMSCHLQSILTCVIVIIIVVIIIYSVCVRPAYLFFLFV